MTGEKENKRKARMNAMAKAILELEMPESCREYPCEGKHPDCPLKDVEEDE